MVRVPLFVAVLNYKIQDHKKLVRNLKRIGFEIIYKCE